jgi:hypothetical protein
MPKMDDAVPHPRGQVPARSAPASHSTGAPDRPGLHLIQQRRFVPVEWDGDLKDAPARGVVTVDLGGEVMRCTVRRVVDQDTVLLELTGVPMSRNHGFKQGDFVGARRRRALNGRDDWKAVDPRIVSEVETRKLAEERQARLERPEPPAKKRGERT